MHKLLLSTLVLVAALLSGCDQMAARTFGGSVNLPLLPANAQLISMTWKGSSLWVLYYLPDTRQCVFKEDAAGGVLEGVVTLNNCVPASFVASPATSRTP